MSLRDQALADVGVILESTLDFGVAITLTDPAGLATAMTGHTGDIRREIDADTGAIIKGRTIYVTLWIPSLPAGARPEGTNNTSLKPWLVSFGRITTGAITQYAVVGSDPDDSAGTIILELGNWGA